MSQSIQFIRALLLCSLCTTTFSLNAQELYFPPNGSETWETLSPDSLGWCQENIDALYTFLDEQDSKAFLILKDGKIVLEHYTGTFTADSSWYWASAGKTLTAFLVGIAQEDGLLSIDEPSSAYLGTGWSSCTEPEENQILIRHQLSMTTGFDDGVSNQNCTLPECLNCIASPGTRWAYHNAPYTLLDNVVSNASGQNLNVFAYQNVFTPTGMNGLYIYVGDNNVFFSKARTMARFGLLLLNNGNWNGNNILGDQEYLHDMTHSSQDINPSYGYLTWLNGYEQVMLPQTQIVFEGPLFPAAPMDTYAALGKDGQILNVVPSQGLVVVRMGNAPGPEYLVPSLLNDDIWEYINELPCSPNALTENTASEELFSVQRNANSDEWIINSELSQAFHWQVFNVSGQKVLEGRNETQVSLYSLRSGMYLLRIQTLGQEPFVFKLFKD
jgi:CubicO group peptidase (beta-lactamase class C family)